MKIDGLKQYRMCTFSYSTKTEKLQVLVAIQSTLLNVLQNVMKSDNEELYNALLEALDEVSEKFDEVEKGRD